MGPAAPGRIPWTAVQRWCERHGYGADEAEFLDRGLMAMDEAYIAWYAEQAKAASK